jgi:hypothetical protein
MLHRCCCIVCSYLPTQQRGLSSFREGRFRPTRPTRRSISTSPSLRAAPSTPGLAEENDTSPIDHSAIDLYSVVGETATLAAAASATQTGNVQLNAAVNPGSCIMAVSEAPLALGNFGPLNPASTNKVGYFFEIGISGAFQDSVIVGCSSRGNLNSTFSFTSGPEGC